MKNLVDLNEELNRAALKAMGWKVTDQYERLLKQGYPQDALLELIRVQLATIDGSTSWDDTEKVEAKLELARFVKERLPEAPADWGTVDNVFTDAELDEINQSKVIRTYVDYLTYLAPTTRKEDVETLDPEKLLAEGWIDVFNDEGEQPLLTEQSAGDLDLLSWMRRKVKPHKTTKAKPSGIGAALGTVASMVTGTSAKTHIFHHPSLHLFTGTIAGKSVKPMSEKAFFSHLVTQHGFDPAHAQSFIENVRSGNATGHGATKATDHLQHALHYAKLARTAHDGLNHEQRDKHLSVVHHHLDRAFEMANHELKKNPKGFLGAHHKNHPLMSHVHAISHLIKGMD